ncbi:uracil-DNA glycosylase family protein [Methylobacter sp. BlB1]|uniref:uracil-DNA glycosylase n=1 Tax=Methylobacter sp. BlB1 TaxID=2785914 RepID=UPI001893B98C|nr:uracil-DNA glycosylase [Methylobacter sp. BlB1]MBF6650479.1 uracil-DNA glycosylase [Methylobacter sp. BlB1]
MDNALRLQYLEAMGIDIWVPRAAPAPDRDEQLLIDNAAPEAAALAPTDHEPAQPGPDNWESLQAEVAACRKCALCETRTQTVFGTGNKQADWMVIGEAPGQSEDLQGQPFVGKAGQLLTEMLRALGLAREDVFIANILKCRPPGNRDPKPDEIDACHAYLQRQRALVQPRIILAVGRIAAQALLKTEAPLARLRGKVHTLDETPVVVVYHPAYLLRSLPDKRKAWMDLQLAMKTYTEG